MRSLRIFTNIISSIFRISLNWKWKEKKYGILIHNLYEFINFTNSTSKIPSNFLIYVYLATVFFPNPPKLPI